MDKRLELLNTMRERGQPRVWTTRLLNRAIDAPPTTTARIIKWAVESEVIRPVVNGIYVNNMAFPYVKIAEAAGWIRTGAIVSLQSVLGDSGVLNNPTPDVTCVMATTAPSTSGGTIRAISGAYFSFRRLSPKMITAGDIKDRFDQKVTYLRATPEKALLDWLVLGLSPHSNMTMPPYHDIDIDELDLGRMERLATAMGIEKALEAFLIEHERIATEITPYSEGVSPFGL